MHVSSIEVPSVKPGAWAAFWEIVTRFQKDKITPWIALRNTVGVTLPLIAGAAAGSMAGGLALSTGALNVSFSDSHEPYSVRARRMLSASVLVGIAVFAGAICGHNYTAAVIVAGLWALAVGFLVALSTTAADLGVLSLVVLVVYAAAPQPLERAVNAGLLAFAGGLLQTLLALAFWPLRRYVPERRALGNLYVELSRSIASPVQVWQAPPASLESTTAQNALAPLNRNHSPQSERYLLLLSQAERMRLSLLTLGRLHARIRRETPNTREAVILDRYFDACSRILRAIGDTLLSGEAAAIDPEVLQQLQSFSEELRALSPPDSSLIAAGARDARFQMDSLTGQLRSALDLVVYATPSGTEAFDRREAHLPWRLRLSGALATLRANLTWNSAASRHAIRLAFCVSAGYALALRLELHRAYWLPMTIAIVLKPDFTATFSRGLLRLIGTFLGLAVATLLFHFLPPSVAAQIALLAVLMYVLRWIGAANYGILVVFITALVVVLFALLGVPPKQVIAARAINTAAGGTIALLAYWLWPTWERTLVQETVAQLLDAYRIYFRAIREAYLNPGQSFGKKLDRARLSARLARSNLEASIDRLIAEPGTAPKTIQLLGGMLASSHRLVHALMALEAGLSSSSPVPARPGFRVFGNDVELTLYYLAAGLRGSPLAASELPCLREDHNLLIQTGDARTERHALVNVETDRITNSLNTFSEDLLRWLEASPVPKRI